MTNHNILAKWALIMLLYLSHPATADHDCSKFMHPAPPIRRNYSVVAIPTPIAYNRFGDIDYKGKMFALEENMAALNSFAENFNSSCSGTTTTNTTTNPCTLEDNLKMLNPMAKPLILRCNVGDGVEVTLTNYIQNRSVSIQLSANIPAALDEDSYDKNTKTHLVKYGEKVVYKWKCRIEGAYHFFDGGSYSGTINGTSLHGLYGALIVEPMGSYWTDPTTGKETVDALSADIHPAKPDCSKKKPFLGIEAKMAEHWESFREHVIFFHAAPVAVTQPMPADPCEDKGKNPSFGDTLGINYRSAPIRNVHRLVFDKINTGDEGMKSRPTYGEEQHHSSWFNGDPDTPTLRNYAGDPVRIRLIHAGVKETHMFHLHVHQWYMVEGDHTSPIIDSIAISPQTSFTFTLMYGAGSKLKAIGDVIYHCHLYPHFAAGMWGLFRVFDKVQDGSQKYPDMTQIIPLFPLPDREMPPKPTAEKPGYPNFIDGKAGQKSPRVPWPVKILGPIPEGSDYREATQLEMDAMNADPQPGNFFTLNPMPRGPLQVSRNIIATVRNVLYNRYGWHDTQGHMFQLEEEEFGDPAIPTAYVPLTHRVNSNSVVTNRLTSKMPANLAATVFDPGFPDCPARACEMEVGLHVHLVKFDVLACDGSSVGWNYMSGTRIGKFYYFRWWVDEEFGQVFFHDHLFPVYRQKRGMYGIMSVQAEGAIWVKPDDHKQQAVTGISAVILNGNKKAKCPTCNFKFDMSAYREIVQNVADFVPAFDKEDNPVNAPPFPGMLRDNGVMVVNYRCEPIRERVLSYIKNSGNSAGPDPADLFSSKLYGDPSTYLFESYPGDQIVIRLVQGAHEETHSLNAFGFRWHDTNLKRHPYSSQQAIGISEQFNMYVDINYGPGDKGLVFRAADSLWLGCWSILRVYPSFVGSLAVLPNNPMPLCGSKAFAAIPKGNQNHRHYKVTAKNQVIDYTKGFRGLHHIDPFGVVYQVTAMKENDGEWQMFDEAFTGEPMVIRAREGEMVSVHLTNGLDPQGMFQAEPNRTKVPAELVEYTRISSRVSIHADMVLTDSNMNEGSFFGFNMDTTVALGKTRTYTWYIDGPLGTIPLQDQADFRNHRHHGLVGALIIEDPKITVTKWTGTETTLYSGTEMTMHESVIILQDGMRHFVNGDLTKPVVDGMEGGNIDPADQGQKGMNYGSAMILENIGMESMETPPTKVFTTRKNVMEKMCLVGTHDKTRPITFVVHGHIFDNSTVVKKNAMNPGFSGEVTFMSGMEGDWIYRAGNLKYHVSEGMWGILRVQGGDGGGGGSGGTSLYVGGEGGGGEGGGGGGGGGGGAGGEDGGVGGGTWRVGGRGNGRTAAKASQHLQASPNTVAAPGEGEH